MDIHNNTDLSAISFRQIRAGDAAMMACLTVKATCDLVPGHPLILSDEQDAIRDEDLFIGDPHETALIETSDIVPFRPGADLTIVSNAVPPDHGQPDWFIAGCAVGDQLYRFRVEGPKHWVHRNGEWQLEREAVQTPTALHWANTYGGVVITDDGPPFDVVRDNPLGCGALDLSKVPTDREIRAPIISDPDKPIEEVSTDILGCAPVPPWWRPRQRHTGTMDQDWLDHVHPTLPKDFDYAFYQTAAPQLIRHNYFGGGEEVTLANLLPDTPRLKTSLPKWKPKVQVRSRTNEIFPISMNLDGCHFQLTGPRAKVLLTWRQWLEGGDKVTSFQIDIDDADGLLRDTRNAHGINRACPWETWLS